MPIRSCEAKALWPRQLGRPSCTQPSVPRVLVVEDDAPTRELLEFALSTFGITVTTACDGKEGLERLRQEPPCVVLLDLMMPVMDGSSFRRAQLEDPRLAKVPVVLVTAIHNPAARAQQLCVNGWIQKPFEVEQVVEAVLSYCGMQGTTVAPASQGSNETPKAELTGQATPSGSP